MKQLEKQARYAQRSLSRDLLFQTYGQACMARQLEALKAETQTGGAVRESR